MTHISRRVRDYSGMPLEAFLNLGWEAFLHPDDFENPESILQVDTDRGIVQPSGECMNCQNATWRLWTNLPSGHQQEAAVHA